MGKCITAYNVFSPCLSPYLDFPGGSDGKASVYNAGDLGLIPGLGRFPGEGNGNPLQYSCLKNPMDGGAWCRLLSMGWQRGPTYLPNPIITKRKLKKTFLNIFKWVVAICSRLILYHWSYWLCNCESPLLWLPPMNHKELISCVQLFATPWTVHGILYPRILEWVVFPFPSQLRDWTQVIHTAGRFFTSWATREAQEHGSG